MFVGKFYPKARLLRTSYTLMVAGGAFCILWGAFKLLPLGILAVAILAVGAVVGIVGAARKELRMNV